MKKILTWGAVAFLIFFVAYRPQAAAGVFKSIGSSIADVGSGMVEFVSNLVT